MDFNITAPIPPSFSIASTTISLLFFGASPAVVAGHVFGVVSLSFMVVALVSHGTTIIPLSNTQQVISLKLSNTIFLYCRMQIKFIYYAKECIPLLMVHSHTPFSYFLCWYMSTHYQSFFSVIEVTRPLNHKGYFILLFY